MVLIAGRANATFSNYCYIGIPLVILLFGQEAIFPDSLFLNLIDNFKSILKNPVIISCVIGLILSFYGINLGKVPEETLNILSSAAVPTALFAIGIIIISKNVEITNVKILDSFS